MNIHSFAVLAGIVNVSGVALNLNSKDQRTNLELIEEHILERHLEKLVTLAPKHFHMLTKACKVSRYRSELLYLMEPHIISGLRGLSADKALQIASTYLSLG